MPRTGSSQEIRAYIVFPSEVGWAAHCSHSLSTSSSPRPRSFPFRERPLDGQLR
jgi:hypothetical protein